MQSVFDTPMASDEIEKASRTGLDGRKVGDEIDDFLSGLAGFVHRHSARQTSHLTNQWPGGSQVLVHAATHLDRASLDPSPAPIDGAVALKGSNEGLRLAEKGGQIGIQSGLIGFDSQHTADRADAHHLHEGGVGMEGIRCVNTRMQRQARQEQFGDGDLVGFGRDAHLQQRFLTQVGAERQQMGTFVRGFGRSTHRLAIQGNGIFVSVGATATGVDPGGQQLLDMTHTQAG